MNLSDYQALAMRTKSKTQLDNSKALNCACLGIAGESGEFIDLVKKIQYQGKFQSFEVDNKLFEELGDILWYLALAADSLDFSLSDIATYNIQKLKRRYPTEFSPDLAQKRLDENPNLPM